MNIPWIAAFCDNPAAKQRLIIVAEALEQEFGHVLKPREPIAWHKASAGVIKHMADHGVFMWGKESFTKLAAQMDNLGEEDE
jgi:hypothetical protein